MLQENIYMLEKLRRKLASPEIIYSKDTRQNTTGDASNTENELSTAALYISK